MRSEHYPLEKLKREIIAIIARYLDLRAYRVFFFGSRVAGRGNDRSDFDVGIEGNDVILPDIMEHIREEIGELPTLYKIDIVDFRRVSAEFRRVAMAHAEPITETVRP